MASEKSSFDFWVLPPHGGLILPKFSYVKTMGTVLPPHGGLIPVRRGLGGRLDPVLPPHGGLILPGQRQIPVLPAYAGLIPLPSMSDLLYCCYNPIHQFVAW